MADETEIKLKFQRNGKAGKGVLAASMAGEAIHTDKFDLTDAGRRARFAEKVCEGRPGIDRDMLDRELEGLAGNCVDDEADIDKITQSQAMVKLADGAELFNDGNDAYATIEIDGQGGADRHRETHPIKGKHFRDLLGGRYWNSYAKPAGGQATQDALEALCGRAMYEGRKSPVAVRIAQHDAAIYFDLANDRWQAVKLTPGQWEVVNDPPVRFIRKRGMLPMPVPVRGGSVDELRPLLNAGDDDTWRLIVAWLLGAFRPTGPYAVLAVNGEQGSAKSTTCKMIRRLIDPNEADLRAAPREERELMIAAGNSWIVAFDNLSSLPPALSDSLCRLATGGGFSTRTLYSNDDEKIFNASRAILLNGIEEITTRPDLLERAISLNLPTIADENRKTEAEIWRRFDDARPRILGALLDAVAVALRNLPTVKLPRRPRMADFAEWIVAAEPALPWPAGAFLPAYERNRGDANELAIEASAIGPAIQAFMADQFSWEGQAMDLLNALSAPPYADARTIARLDWPKTPKTISDQLRRIAPTLRKLGIGVEMGKKQGKMRKRIVRLEKVSESSSASSATSANDDSTRAQATAADDVRVASRTHRPPQTSIFDAERGTADGADGADDVFRARSA